MIKGMQKRKEKREEKLAQKEEKALASKEKKEQALVEHGSVAKPIIDALTALDELPSPAVLASRKGDHTYSAGALESVAIALGCGKQTTKLKNAEAILNVLKSRRALAASRQHSADHKLKCMRERVEFLLSPAHVDSTIETKLQGMLTTAHFLRHRGHEIYGGFIRDVVINDDLHADVDLDVEAGTDRAVVSATVDALRTWAAGVNMEVVDADSNYTRKGPNVLEVDIKVVATGDVFVVQLCNTSAFATRGLVQCDLDVNNLKMSGSGIIKKVESQGASLDVLITQIHCKTFRLLKPRNQIKARVTRMTARVGKC